MLRPLPIAGHILAYAETLDGGGVERALLRLAATSGIHAAAEVVDMAYRSAGATAVFESQPFERRFRDVHAVTQQTQANPRHFEAVGRVLLGLEATNASA